MKLTEKEKARFHILAKGNGCDRIDCCEGRCPFYCETGGQRCRLQDHDWRPRLLALGTDQDAHALGADLATRILIDNEMEELLND